MAIIQVANISENRPLRPVLTLLHRLRSRYPNSSILRHTIRSLMQRILITGIGSGLGKALAEYYLARDAQVYALGRHLPEDLKEHPRLRFQSCDLHGLDRRFGLC